MLFQAVVLAALGIFFLGHITLHRFMPPPPHHLSLLTRLQIGSRMVQKAPCRRHSVLWSTGSLSDDRVHDVGSGAAADATVCQGLDGNLVPWYATENTNSLPLQISGKYVWWYDAEIKCLEPVWQKMAIVAVAVLGPLPFVCVYILHRWETVEGLSSWQKEMRQVLTNGFKPKRRWWLGVSLLRRLLLVITFTQVIDLTWKAVAMCVLCICESQVFSTSPLTCNLNLPPLYPIKCL